MKDIFPSLVNFEVFFGFGFTFTNHQSHSAFQDLLARVTTVRTIANLHPFTVLTQCPSAKSASFNCSKPFTVPANTHLDHSTLTDLCIIHDDFSYDDLKLLFSSFPALTDLTVCFKLLPGFDERDFVHFLENNKPAVAKLKSLTFRGPKEMTGKSVCALLQNSNLEKFDNFSEIEFSGTDLKVFEEITRNRGMKIIPFYRHEFRHFCFTCENGNHKLRCFQNIF